MLFTFEDALQIHHAKCEKIEVYKLANPAMIFTATMSWWLSILLTARITKKKSAKALLPCRTRLFRCL